MTNDNERVTKSPTEARAAVRGNGVIWVVGAGLFLVIMAFAAVYAAYFG
jgi:hypothetical protein